MVPIPLNDNLRRQTFWISTLLLIVVNALAFLFELSLGGPNLDRLIFHFGVVPAHYTTPQGIAALNLPGFFAPVFASMFLHAGWLHLAGNMLFLFVFGRSVEDRFGHLKFLFMYFLSGLGAASVHILLNAGSRVPTVGASGAIAGILGAYLISFPNARITTLIPLLFFFWSVQLPAVLVLGYWFLIQFVTGFEMLAIQSATHGSGVAWWAHVGGFIVGMVLCLALRPRRRRPLVQAYSS
jgi:membrane associated rhomboid family serine protease